MDLGLKRGPASGCRALVWADPPSPRRVAHAESLRREERADTRHEFLDDLFVGWEEERVIDAAG